MNLNGVAKLYGKLTPRERLPLIIAAVERGDDVEADRLAKSAPRKDHRLQEYFLLADALERVSLHHLLCLQERTIRLLRCLASSRLDKKELPDGLNLAQLQRFRAYEFVVEADAWRLMMAELRIDPESFLRDLPGYQESRAIEGLARVMAFDEAEATLYLKQSTNAEAEPITAQARLLEMQALLDRRIGFWI